MNKNKVAVVLVNYNGIDDTIECIESIYRSDCVDDVAIIVVDNASKENEALAISKKLDEVITIRSEVNAGFSGGNNIGIRKALEEEYEFILILNNDTIVLPDMISRLRDNCDDSSISAPNIFYYPEKDVIWYDGDRINRMTGKFNRLFIKDENDPNIKECNYASGCCWMVKASIFKKIGLLNEDYFMYCEDMEFCLRLKINNIKINYTPSAKLYHKVSSTTGRSKSPFRTYYSTRNRLNYLKEYSSEFHWITYWYSFITRYTRMLVTRDKDMRKAYRQGILDHKRNIKGAAWKG